MNNIGNNPSAIGADSPGNSAYIEKGGHHV